MYVIAGLPLAVVGFAANLVTLWFPMIQASAPAMRKLGDANRFLAFRLAGERVPPPPPMCAGHIHLRTPDPAGVSALVAAHGGRVRELKDEGRHGSQLKISGLPAARLAGLAAAENITVSDIYTHPGWMELKNPDMPALRARAYLALKLPVSVVGLFVSGCCWLFGLGFLLYPVLWEIAHHTQPVAAGTPIGLGALTGITLPGSFAAIPVGAAMLLAAPWLTPRPPPTGR